VDGHDDLVRGKVVGRLQGVDDLATDLLVGAQEGGQQVLAGDHADQLASGDHRQVVDAVHLQQPRMALSPRPVVRSIRLRTARNPGDALIAGRTSLLKKATFSSTLSFLVVWTHPRSGFGTFVPERVLEPPDGAWRHPQHPQLPAGRGWFHSHGGRDLDKVQPSLAAGSKWLLVARWGLERSSGGRGQSPAGQSPVEDRDLGAHESAIPEAASAVGVEVQQSILHRAGPMATHQRSRCPGGRPASSVQCARHALQIPPVGVSRLGVQERESLGAGRGYPSPGGLSDLTSSGCS
jgi:hypothetical protein